MLNVGTDRSTERAVQDYVKAIYQLGESGAPVRAVDVAKHFDVSRSSVSQFKPVLRKRGFLGAAKPGSSALDLTASGRELAVRMVRRHRILETFLYTTLGVPLERVHPEAERLEHAVSDDLVERIASLIGRPAADPHGHPIPYGATVASTWDEPLTGVPGGCDIVVTQIADHDAAVVKELVALGVLPGLRATVVRRAGRLRLFADARGRALSPALAASVRCRIVDGAQ